MHRRSLLVVFSVLFQLIIGAAAVPASATQTAADFGGKSVLIVHYHRPAMDYEGWNLWVWPQGGGGQAVQFSGFDDFGPYAVVPFDEGHEAFGLIVRRGEWVEKEGDADRFVRTDERGVAEVWLKQGEAKIGRSPRAFDYQPQQRPDPQHRRTPDPEKLTRVAPRSAAAAGAGTVVIVHYHRPDGVYSAWDAWAWAEGAAGAAYPLAGQDEFGRYATIKLADRVDQVGLIMRTSDWSRREVGGDRSIPIGEDGVSEVWIVAGDRAIYTDPASIDFSPRISNAFLDALDRVTVRLNDAAQPEAVDPTGAVVRVGDREHRVAACEPKDLTLFGAQQWTLRLAEPIPAKDLAQSMRVAIVGFAPAAVEARDALTDPQVTPLDARLGPIYTPEATTFRTWSPVASKVELILEGSGGDAKPQPAERVIAMTRDERGLWETRVGGDLHGAAYAYRFHVYGKTHTMPDVHGFAANAGSTRSVVVDLRRTDPAGFRNHQPPTSKSPTDEVIYEIHVRDFSIHDPNVPEAHRGRYLGLTHTNNEGTSLSHLRELGVTTVHLLPIQDIAGSPDHYNWGYWTELFNVPEPRYSTTPDDAANTIRELKQTIRALHDAGIRVVLDVVYNHTASSFEHSPFDAAVPWHYFRSNDDGTLRNESGTGNAFADERPMARKYIVDSLKFWVEEYKVDGFRFDLLGMHHPETVRQVERELRAVRPDILIYGEPWTGGGPTHFGKGAQRGMAVAVFNDHFRNAVRGELDGPGHGFATGAWHVDDLKRGIMGAIDDFADAPTESVNYVSAHDNLTLWDKLALAMPGANEKQRAAAQKLALGIVLTSQGMPFLHGGSDFARTKGGNHDSYNAGDEVNAFDWGRKARFRAMHEYIAGLIELRREHPAFRMASTEEVRQNLRWLHDDDVVAYALNGEATGDAWRTIVVALNGHDRAAQFELPDGRWTVVVDDERAGTVPLSEARGRATLPPRSMMVLVRE